jgi:hypothetical protein
VKATVMRLLTLVAALGVVALVAAPSASAVENCQESKIAATSDKCPKTTPTVTVTVTAPPVTKTVTPPAKKQVVTVPKGGVRTGDGSLA